MSSKGDLMVDEKKKKRMISNRESARRSRMKKEKHMKDLNEQIFYFTKKRDEMVLKIKEIFKGHSTLEMENIVLRTQKQELAKRLEYAKAVCDWYEGVGVSSPMGGVQDPWLRPFEQQPPPSNSVPVMSSAGFSKF
ncbi:hypothetical protein L2E82_28026 [Cichorium intybus]|uniref:Uncharacterized protein n=1 Tax=Cichorium intybus TaxID=13427 RepID=A0ACB9CUH5_CICIN|nr:hypothetical protein L2E82_28026 [Cichorium intybus]